MAYPFEWIPKFGNHPEKVAGKEYTPSPGRFTRGCGGLSGTGFSLWGFVLARAKTHRLKPVLLNPRFFREFIDEERIPAIRILNYAD
jgi:hypothetical protein